MSVRVHTDRSAQPGRASANGIAAETPIVPIRIGLVNNMPEGAFKATENQFRSLLESAAGDFSIDLSLYVLSKTSAVSSDGDHSRHRYKSTRELMGQSLDGLIVTGTEPIMAALQDEPFWQSFAELVAWARENTLSTIWSCLAAHAAVLQMDGIERRRHHDKRFGIFACQQVSESCLLEGTATSVFVPHSRWNGLDEDKLAERGYSILTKTLDGEVDAFTKEESSLFLFFQGHPEYATDTLLREYRRDIGRFLHNGRTSYPKLPRGYFNSEAEEAFATLQEKAHSLHRDEVLAAVASATHLANVENTWHATSKQLYKNWLRRLHALKTTSTTPDSVVATHASSGDLST